MSNTPPPASNKLYIRSEVLAVIQFLGAVENPPREDRIKQVRRLSSIEDQPSVQKILLKELQRASSSPQTLQVIVELLMEMGTLDTLQEPLWAMIESRDANDELKDAANLILRHLGDRGDPNLYLDYLQDPEGLINRETERMLEVSTKNPEALIDFIDFIFSLPVAEQLHLVESLQTDYPPNYLANIYIPALLATPPFETMELLLKNLGQTRLPKAALFLSETGEYFSGNDTLYKAWQKACSELRIAGIYKEDLFDEYRRELVERHPIVTDSTVDTCYATLPDGMGNQGIIISRQYANGDVAMMSVAVNDQHGIIDCFGFHQLGIHDFNKICERFHEESSKIKAPAGYCMAKLNRAEAMNIKNRYRLPYEYSCWKPMLGDITHDPSDWHNVTAPLAKDDWRKLTGNLYQHPDFITWFLEDDDHPAVVVSMARLQASLSKPDPDNFVSALQEEAGTLARALLSSPWRDVFTERLIETAYFLHLQDTQTFAGLAAT